MKFMAICGTGLGSSFMLEMNLRDVLKELGVEGVEVTHSSMSDATQDSADVFCVAADLEDSAKHLKNVVILKNIFDKEDMKVKMRKVCIEKNLLTEE